MMNTLYPASEPIKTHRLQVSTTHNLYIAEYGNPHGIPVLYCHGGPGAGSKPQHAQYFDPKHFRVILFDQRGSGLSKPLGSLEENTTAHLIADMEKIREYLEIDTWVVGGGSWGTTLSLVYAETYPERVLSLILRGVFLGRAEDALDLLHDQSPAALFHYPAWVQFIEKTKSLAQAANISMQNKPLLTCYMELLNHGDVALRREAASTMSRWELQNAYLNDAALADIEWSMSDDGVNMGLMEVTYLFHHCYLEDNQILKNAHLINHIPTHVIHGKYDLVCLPKQADLLCQELKNCTRYYPIAGHSGSEPETIDAMVNASQAIAEHLQVVLNNH